MAETPRKTFLGLLFSAPTLIPIILGIGAALFLGLRSDKQLKLAAFVGVIGVLGGLGTFMTMLLLSGKTVNPIVARKRAEMLSRLAELTDDGRFSPSVEADQPAVAAATERL